MKTEKWTAHLQYSWPVYGAVIGCTALFWCFLFHLSDAVPASQRLNIACFGQGFLAEEWDRELAGERSGYGLRETHVTAEYAENRNYLSYLLAVRAVGDTDVVIIEEPYLYDGIGNAYFAELSAELMREWFPGAELYTENGATFGLLLYDGADETAFVQRYQGKNRCWAFLTPACQTAGSLNDGEAGNTRRWIYCIV